LRCEIGTQGGEERNGLAYGEKREGRGGRDDWLRGGKGGEDRFTGFGGKGGGKRKTPKL